MNGNERRNVLWFGAPPTLTDLLEFEQRDLSVRILKACDWWKDLITARAVVIKYLPKKPGLVQKCLESGGRVARNNGLWLIGIAEDERGIQVFREASRRLKFKDDELILAQSPKPHLLPQKLLSHDPGPSASFSLRIDKYPSSELRLKSETELFLRRAFSDCEAITIRSLTGGKTADVFCVYALFNNGPAGPRPLPFFAKVGRLRKIEEERDNYKDYVLHYVTFNQRPNLAEARCIMGLDHGMLVGDFVDRAEPLLSVVRRGHGQGAIHSLFDDALKGWRIQAEGNAKESWKVFFEGRRIFDPSKIPSARVDKARKLGATKTPTEIKTILSSDLMDPYLRVPIHGDLHALNVMVRDGDAILIDFASIQHGPLTADPASLEVSLVFSAEEDEKAEKDEEDEKRWLELINTLYMDEVLDKVPLPAKEPHPREWLWNIVRQIRQIGLGDQRSGLEYRMALAGYLMRHAMYPSLDSERDELRRTYAYITASRIVTGMERKVQ